MVEAVRLSSADADADADAGQRGGILVWGWTAVLEGGSM
jgi:hypothetical protein